MKNTKTKTTSQVQMLNEEELDMVNGGVATWVKNLTSEAPLLGPLIQDIMDDYDGTKSLSIGAVAADLALGAVDASIIGYPVRALGTAIYNFFKYIL